MRQHIIDTAGRLFYAEGIRAVGIDRLVAEAKVAKATLYNHFRAKDELVAAYLDARHERLIGGVEAIAADTDTAPQERIRMLFLALREKAETPEFRGCAFMLAVAEHEGSPNIIDAARHHKNALKSIFSDLCGSFAKDAPALAERIALCYEGALATISVNRDPRAADVALSIIDALLAADAGAER